MLTLDQCLDRLAELDGWTKHTHNAAGVWRGPDGSLLSDTRHPIPPTLDAVAALWPEGWHIEIGADPSADGTWCWDATGWAAAGGGEFREIAYTEIHARAAVTVAVLEHIAKEKANDVA